MEHIEAESLVSLIKTPLHPNGTDKIYSVKIYLAGFSKNCFKILLKVIFENKKKKKIYIPTF